MYQKCPKCAYRRQPDDTGDRDICPACGLVFSKYLKTRFRSPDRRRGPDRDNSDGRLEAAHALLFPAPDKPVARSTLLGKTLLWLFFAAWGLRLIWMDFETNAIGGSFMHLINLMFHEAGHAIFRPFGSFMTYLGGSLMQLIVPGVFVVAFLVHMRDAFGAAISLWWFGTSLMDLAPYIGDARAMQLTLLGGGTGRDRPGMHDWNEILSRLGLLDWDRGLAWLADCLGELTVLASLAWSAMVLWKLHAARS
ncbi:MAG: hypothetical protein R3200_16695 [Xanthomonadales bacterium]|nr:hypothetical protein [Xanthomonadales bacterium]